MADQHASGGLFCRFLSVIFLALLPGFWLAPAFCGVAAADTPGVVGVAMTTSGVAFGALWAALGTGSGRLPARGALLAALLCYPLLAGNMFAPLPVGFFAGALLADPALERYRGWFGAAFAAGVAGIGCYGGFATKIEVVLYPLVLTAFFFGGLRNCRWYWRIGLILLLPMASAFLAWNRVLPPPVDTSRAGTPVPPALPASLLPQDGARRILFLSNLMSRLPGVWCALPYVEEVVAVWPGGTLIRGDAWSKMRVLAGPPGKMAAAAGDDFDLIFVETLPPSGAMARREFFAVLAGRLKPAAGVLVVPVEYAADLPELGDRLLLPGGEGRFLAVGKHLNGHSEYLDGKLQHLLRDSDSGSRFMPPGIFSALYEDASEPVRVNSPPSPERPRLPWDRFALAIVCWLVLRLVLYRRGLEANFTGMVEACAALTLIALAAAARLAELELTSGIPPVSAMGVLGLILVPFVLRNGYAERIFVLTSALLPFVATGNWILPATVPAAFATAETVSRVRRDASPSARMLTLRIALGVCLGSMVFRGLGCSPEAALLLALILRFGWVIR